MGRFYSWAATISGLYSELLFIYQLGLGQGPRLINKWVLHPPSPPQTLRRGGHRSPTIGI